MPQHNDTPEQQKAFLDYFKPICDDRNTKRRQALNERLLQETRQKREIMRNK